MSECQTRGVIKLITITLLRINVYDRHTRPSGTNTREKFQRAIIIPNRINKNSHSFW